MDETIKIKFPFPPLSQNNIERTGFQTNIRYKTKEAKDYKKRIGQVMMARRQEIINFCSNINPSFHVFSVEYVWKINKDRIFTKKNPKRIKLTAPDWDNPIKYTQDVIFDWMGFKDALIWSASVKRVPVTGRCEFDVIIQYEDVLLNDYHKDFF